MFRHEPQKQFYTNYAIKDQQAIDEFSLNLAMTRLKKEVQDIWNRFQILNGKLAQEWERACNYEVNEICSFEQKNYICLVENINKVPTEEQSFWREIDASEVTNTPFDEYLSKTNNTPYDPEVQESESISPDYHPTTVKFVLDKLKYWFDNKTVYDSDRLGGQTHDKFMKLADFMQYVQTAVHKHDVIDNLGSDSFKKVLSAKQGKILKGMIDRINSLITSNDINLDELQEIVNWIKQNRELIESLTIDNIIGLREYLDKLDDQVLKSVTIEYWHENFLNKIKEVDGPGTGIDADLLDGRHAGFFLPASKFTGVEISKLLQRIPPGINKIDADKLDGHHADTFLKRDRSSAPTVDASFNIGSASKRWNNLYAINFQGTALKAKYADLAEYYDANLFECDVYKLKAGDVLGINEKGISKYQVGMKLIGIVSDKPGLVINSESDGIPVALKGMVKVKIDGSAKTGDYIYAYNNGVGKAFNEEIKSKYLLLLGVCLKSGENEVLIKV